MNYQCLSTFSLLGKKASRVLRLRKIFKKCVSILNQPLLDLINKKRRSWLSRLKAGTLTDTPRSSFFLDVTQDAQANYISEPTLLKAV